MGVHRLKYGHGKVLGKGSLFKTPQPSKASTFGVFPVGPSLGLVEVVPHSRASEINSIWLRVMGLAGLASG